jgi:hypothetical protein
MWHGRIRNRAVSREWHAGESWLAREAAEGAVSTPRGRWDEWHLVLGNAFGHLAFHLGAGPGQPAVVIPPPLLYHTMSRPLRATLSERHPEGTALPGTNPDAIT